MLLLLLLLLLLLFLYFICYCLNYLKVQSAILIQYTFLSNSVNISSWSASCPFCVCAEKKSGVHRRTGFCCISLLVSPVVSVVALAMRVREIVGEPLKEH